MLYKKKLSLINLRDSWLYLFYTLIIFACTIFLIKQVEINNINLSLYLIITPYLTSSITKTVNFLDIIRNLQNVNIAALRIKTIQEMEYDDLLDFGKNLTDTTKGQLVFTNISYFHKNSIKLKNINFQTLPHSITLIQGIKDCGKRELFKMLSREIRPSKGTVTLDSINIYDFDAKIYSKNISYTCSSPTFFNESIMENLKYIDNSKNAIFSICKEIGLHQKITTLPNGYKTKIENDTLSTFDKFMLSLARCVLSKAEVILIYETPASLSNKELKTFKEVLLKIKKDHTIIIFSALDKTSDICDQHIFIEEGNMIMNKNKENNPNYK